MSGNGGETKSSTSVPAVVIPQLTPEERKALVQGRTIDGIADRDIKWTPSLRTRHYYEDESDPDGAGDALYTARTRGVLRGIREMGQHRATLRPIIKAIGRQNVHFGRLHNPHTKLPSRMGAQGSTTQIPTFLTKRILEHEQPISDLTKTSLGASSKRKGKTRKDPRAGGGRRRKRRKSRRTKHRRRKSRRTKHRRRKSRQHGGLMTRRKTTHSVKPTTTQQHTTQLSKSLSRSSIATVAKALTGGKRKKKKFRKGSKSKTHRGKDFETRKTSKNYNSKRWKRITGRRTLRAPLFPFV